MATRTLSGSAERSRAAVATRMKRAGGHGVTPLPPPEVSGPTLDLLHSRLDRVLTSDLPDGLVTTLVVAGRRKTDAESKALMDYAFRLLRARLASAPARRKLWLWTRHCAARPEIEARQMACALLDAFWKDHRKDVERLLLNLARDENREVRLFAASTMARVIRASFKANLRYLRAWSRHPDPSVRRQVIIATVAVADERHADWGRPLLDLLEPHLSDRDPYIRRNLGPFALGQGMLRVYPEASIERFGKWLGSTDEIVRWNIAMAFTGPIAGLQWEGALEILRVLAADPRRFVGGAAAMALKNLLQLRPQPIEPVLQEWMTVPALRVAVSSALNTSVR
jgi:hypothetical protein